MSRVLRLRLTLTINLWQFASPLLSCAQIWFLLIKKCAIEHIFSLFFSNCIVSCMQTTERCEPSCVNWILIDSSLRLLRRWHKILLFRSRILEIDPKQYDWYTMGIPSRPSMQQWSGREGITLNCIEWSFVFLFSRIYFLHYSLTLQALMCF